MSSLSGTKVPVGEGGMVVTDDDEIASRVRLLGSHGMTSLRWDRHRGHASSYDVVDLGFNYRIDEPRAAMALQRLSRLDTDNARRATAAAAYRRRLSGVRGVLTTMPEVADATPANHLFTVVLAEEIEWVADSLERAAAFVRD